MLRKYAYVVTCTTPIFEKRAMFVCIYGLNFHLKCSFQSILEKNTKSVTCRAFREFLKIIEAALK